MGVFSLGPALRSDAGWVRSVLSGAGISVAGFSSLNGQWGLDGNRGVGLLGRHSKADRCRGAACGQGMGLKSTYCNFGSYRYFVYLKNAEVQVECSRE